MTDFYVLSNEKCIKYCLCSNKTYICKAYLFSIELFLHFTEFWARSFRRLSSTKKSCDSDECRYDEKQQCTSYGKDRIPIIVEKFHDVGLEFREELVVSVKIVNIIANSKNPFQHIKNSPIQHISINLKLAKLLSP